MAKKSFILHTDSLGILDELSDEQAGQLFKMIYNYHNPEKPTKTKITQLVSMAFFPFKNQFERDLLGYIRVVERNKVNGKLGGRPKKKNPKKPKKPDNDNDSDSDSDSDNKKDNNTTVDVLDFFNKTTGTKLRLTDTKKKQIARSMKTFSVDEIQTAILNRTKSQWHIDNGWVQDWDSLFRSDDKIDKMLNTAQKSSSLYTDEEMKKRVEESNIYS